MKGTTKSPRIRGMHCDTEAETPANRRQGAGARHTAVCFSVRLGGSVGQRLPRSRGQSLAAEGSACPSIGRYRIIGILGEGGMGTVYEAVQDQPQRTVALKVIRPDFVLARADPTLCP